MRAGILLVLVIFTATVLADHHSSHGAFYKNDEQRLITRLLGKYVKHGRPVNHASQNVTVHVVGALQKILKFDPVTQGVELIVFGRYKWHDAQLHWDPTHFGGLESVALPTDQVWVPDVSDLSSYKPFVELVQPSFIAHYNGYVAYYTKLRLNALCTVSDYVKMVYKCDLKLGSWTYNAHQLDLVVEKMKEDELYIPSHQWMMVDGKVRKDLITYSDGYGSGQPFAEITTSIFIMKKPEVGHHDVPAKEEPEVEGSGDVEDHPEAEHHHETEHDHEAEHGHEAEHPHAPEHNHETENHPETEHHHEAEHGHDAEHPHTPEHKHETENHPGDSESLEDTENYVEDKKAVKDTPENDVKTWLW